jgi:hypothetical protein
MHKSRSYVARGTLAGNQVDKEVRELIGKIDNLAEALHIMYPYHVNNSNAQSIIFSEILSKVSQP